MLQVFQLFEDCAAPSGKCTGSPARVMVALKPPSRKAINPGPAAKPERLLCLGTDLADQVAMTQDCLSQGSGSLADTTAGNISASSGYLYLRYPGTTSACLVRFMRNNHGSRDVSEGDGNVSASA